MNFVFKTRIVFVSNKEFCIKTLSFCRPRRWERAGLRAGGVVEMWWRCVEMCGDASATLDLAYGTCAELQCKCPTFMGIFYCKCRDGGELPLKMMDFRWFY